MIASTSSATVDAGRRRVLAGEQAAHLRELAVEEAGGGAPHPPPASPSKPMIPSPAPGDPRLIVTSPPPVSAFAVSARALAGTSAAAETSVWVGVHSHSRSDRRKRSVASRRDVRALHLDADTGENGQHVVAPGGTDGLAHGAARTAGSGSSRSRGASSGSEGNSSSGIVWRLNRAEPQTRDTFAPSLSISTGWLGRLRQMSASRRPETSALPSSADLGFQGGAGGGLVVERRQLQAVRGRLDQQPGEHGNAGLDREGARGPGDSVGQSVTIDAKLHGHLLRQDRNSCGVRILPRHADGRQVRVAPASAWAGSRTGAGAPSPGFPAR